MDPDLLLVEERLWVVTAPTGVGIYDFPFSRYFRCRRPGDRPEMVRAVARVGAPPHYPEWYDSLLRDGIELVHSPEEHERCSLLAGWYPLLEDLTPRSLVFDHPPSPDEVADLGWPIFLKGSRQTARHRRHLSIIESPDHLAAALQAYAGDPILRWQPVVCREYVALQPVGEPGGDRIPVSFEFRTFWWNGKLVGDGRYWWGGPDYRWTGKEREAGLAIAQEAARRVRVPFLVVDIARARDGHWLVIECNDGQESGYAGASPFRLWGSILADQV